MVKISAQFLFNRKLKLWEFIQNIFHAQSKIASYIFRVWKNTFEKVFQVQKFKLCTFKRFLLFLENVKRSNTQFF